MPAVETVEYNGITFRRYPESDNPADREYFRPSGDQIRNGVEALHREIWKDANDVDEIPDGHLIHHSDGDTGNNASENLECVTPSEHVRRHPDMGDLTDEEIEKGVEAAKKWHKSDEGRKWHKQHWKESLGAVFENPKTKDCEQCGDEFVYFTTARFCSNACKAKARRERGDDDEQRICVICRNPFTVNKYKEQPTCSRSCGGAFKAWSNRVQSDG